MSSARSAAISSIPTTARPSRRDPARDQKASASRPHAGRSPDGPISRGILLVIDPDPQGRAAFAQFGSTWDVQTCATAAEGLLLAGGLRPDVVVVSAEVSDVPAATVVELLDRFGGVPAIVATDTEHAGQAAAALDAGAVACVPRHYRAQQLQGVLAAVRPSRQQSAEATLRCGRLELSPTARTVRLRGALVLMPPREFQVLEYFMRNEGRVVSQAQLWSAVWGQNTPSPSNTVSVHVRRLRRRLGDDPRDPQIITTVGHSGYLFQPVAG